ncbi:DUF5336 domain-containing protein [Mycobacterium botniense]|uniref:34 kDa antigenic protein n=1 Tax=Mycobacterium botniense TaxID=84962 RepID=A0A7I9XYE7_9MYCO|nr:DUF5336 domain-containing protein [Mycobacterium botniense]GFG74839.1 hypothetical protein MBOT_22040 [Mycobacterium botniense]
MTYSPGTPGYPPTQSPGTYAGSTPSFAKSDSSASKLPLYLTIAVVALGLGGYLAFFGPIYSINSEMGPVAGDVSTAGILMAVVAALLAALLAAASVLPKAKNYSAIVAAVAVLGALLVIAQTVNTPSGWSIGWALWLLLACSVVQAAAATLALLLDAGVVTPPAPRPRYDAYGQYAQYGQYGPSPSGYYGQQLGPYQQQAPQQSGYGSQYGGYSAPSTGGFSALGAQSGAQQGPQQGSQQGPQQGPPTPPTGFPSFSPPPSSAGSQGPGNSANHGGASQGQQSHAQQQYGQGQQKSPSSQSGQQRS